jgi:uncharacterized membrane protein
MTCTTRDGVSAIAITLLVLDLAVPAASGGHLLTALGDQWPSYLAYIVSFASVRSMWSPTAPSPTSSGGWTS